MDTITITVSSKLSADEREVHLYYDADTKLWTMDSTVPKYFRKALRQGWTLVRQYVYDDGTVCGMVLTAPEKSVTIRNTTKKQMSEAQMTNLLSDDDEL
jgi:ligand-binding sensor domain-containing protein